MRTYIGGRPRVAPGQVLPKLAARRPAGRLRAGPINQHHLFPPQLAEVPLGASGQRASERASEQAERPAAKLVVCRFCLPSSRAICALRQGRRSKPAKQRRRRERKRGQNEEASACEQTSEAAAAAAGRRQKDDWQAFMLAPRRL